MSSHCFRRRQKPLRVSQLCPLYGYIIARHDLQLVGSA
ncbi:hypothetical protein JMJ77_0011846 [Colletotrichum scovillei]|uniref:Uncharacterized protein n=1 Tax=Colletotrichum scovillei TaxID=1209932 RepID=A0A9P7QVQ3_9PEZI|nr:hypothetical protein JMJ77_0011846 [Colletotrichum scovillei]KAG7046131.1 hypothetical protein JMJ78_0011199 [Colletotrichum scovillei]KAG7063476.1 hypothetical protein JMJ76_0005941 [Colletotrichum scovillei]